MRFIDDLGAVINSHRLTRIGTCVEWDAFNDLAMGERRIITGGFISNGRYVATGAPTKPYYLAFIVAIIDALRATRDGATVHFTFDRQQNFEKHAIKTYSRMADESIHDPIWRKMGDISFASRLDKLELQAADLLSHCWYSIYSRNVKDLGPGRKRAIQVVTKKNKELRGYHGDSLRRFIDDNFSAEMHALMRSQK